MVRKNKWKMIAAFKRTKRFLTAAVAVISESPSHPRAKSGNVVFDQEFITVTEARNRQTRDALTGRLTTAQAHLNKEAIRTAYLALAEADVLRGDIAEAYHAALRAKDYCTNRAQTMQVSFLVLELAICLQVCGVIY